MTSLRQLAVAWGVVGLLAGVGYALLTVHWNDTLRDPGTILVLAAWLGGILAVLSAVCGLLSLVLGPPPEKDANAGRHALEMTHALTAWIVTSPALVVLDSARLWGHSRFESLLFAVALGLGVGAAATARRLERREWSAALARRVPVVCAIAAGCVALGLAWQIRVRLPAAEADALTVQSACPAIAPDHTVLLIGLDGADNRRIDALIARGRLPAMRQLIEHGMRTNVRSFKPTRSPILWNTIVTGMGERKHGIHGFTELRLPGAARSVQGLDDRRVSPWMVDRGVSWLLQRRLLQPRPVTAMQRRVKTVWNVLSDCGLRVGVVNWFASWPSDEVNGYVVSDNNPSRAAFVDHRIGKQVESVAGVTWPPELLSELSTLDMPVVGDSNEEILGLDIFSGLDPRQRQELLPDPRHTLKTASTIYLADAFAANAALELRRRGDLDFLAVYLSGIDNLSHRFGRLDSVIDGYYEHVDRVLGRFLAQARDTDTIVVVSDHGWDYRRGTLWGHDRAPDGILVMSGAGVRRDAVLAHTPSLLDVAPTLLALYGLPPSTEMDGRTIDDALSPSLLAAVPSPIPTYGVYRARRLDGDAHRDLERTRETLDKLRDLGYIR